jgi:hypothetical protein
MWVCIYTISFSGPRHLLKVSGQLHSPAALSKGKSARFLLNRSLGGPRNRFERNGEMKILDTNLDPNSDSSVVQPETSRRTERAFSVFMSQQQ